MMSMCSVSIALRNFAVQKTCMKAMTLYNMQSKLSSTVTTPGFTKPSHKVEIGEKRTRKPAIPRITLISPDNTVQVTSLEEAQKLSKRRDLKLVKLVDLDTKTQRPIFKLMTGAEYFAEDLKRRDERKAERSNSNAPKGEKMLTLGNRISEHDLTAKANNILRWVSKRYEVRVIINGETNMEQAEKIYKLLEDRLKNDARIVQKRVKGNDIKFQIVPPKQEQQQQKQDEAL